jgi:GxxExxY protein
VIIEVKAIEAVLGVHRAQLLTQMRLASKPAGLLVNFNVELLKHGITRLLNKEALESMGAHN